MALQVVGSRVKRYDGLAHVTGETKFADDWYAPNQLYIKALRTPVYKGRIKKLDTFRGRKSARCCVRPDRQRFEGQHLWLGRRSAGADCGRVPP